MEPLLSVITVNFNNLSGLRATMESVKSQLSRNFEWIVIDGGSDDGSKEFIKSNSDLISYWVSEKDNGVYDAQNKGLLQSRGKYVIFLNSGDSFYSNEVSRQFQRQSDVSSAFVFYGNSCLTNSKDKPEILTPPARLTNAFFYKNTLNHQACFILRSKFLDQGYYNLNYRICADFDFLLRLYTRSPDQFKYLPFVVCCYDQSGMSAKLSNYNSLVEERERILRYHFGNREFKRLRRQHEAALPWKRRWLLKIYRIPFLGELVKRILTKMLLNERNA